MRWCWIVSKMDTSGVVTEERFLGENSARNRCEELERAGFYRVHLRPVRVKINQPRVHPYVHDRRLH